MLSTPKTQNDALLELIPEALRDLEEGRADGGAVNELARVLIGPLRAFMSRKGWGLDDPERAASETLSLVLASLDKYDSNRGAPMAWVWGLARNHLHELLRLNAKAGGAISVPNEYESEHARKHHLAIVSPEQRVDLLAAVLGLSEEDYQLLFLLFVERKDASEVAEVLGISPASIRQKKRRLVARLESVYRSGARHGSNNKQSHKTVV